MYFCRKLFKFIS